MTDMVALTVLCGIKRLDDGGITAVETCGLIAISDLHLEFTSTESGIHSG